MKTDYKLIWGTWIITRGLMALVAAVAIFTQNKSLTDVLGNWDVQHFLTIAESGYTVTNDVAFFPGWPLLRAQKL